MKNKSLGNFIDGNWLVAHGAKHSSTDPTNNSTFWSGNLSSKKEVDLAIRAAARAFDAWSVLSVDERLVFLERFVKLVEQNKDEIANAISYEIGKPKWEALTEVEAVIGKVAPTKEAYESRASTLTRTIGSTKSITRFFPHGVAVVLSPFNFPIHMANGHIMPALYAGNTVIWKPSELCPHSAETLMDLWRQSGIPAGVINLVHGKSDVGQQLISSDLVSAILFTGSRRAGLSINSALASQPWKIVALEMGGNSPLVVWDYKDIKTAIFITIQSCYITSGQRCSAARRLIVQRKDREFVNELTKAVENLRVSSPFDSPPPYMGPMVSVDYAKRLLAGQDKLVSDGGKILLECKLLKRNSAFISPGLIDVTDSKDRDYEEIFGPLLQVIFVDSFEEAIDEANRSQYGLAAGLIATDQGLYEKFLKRVKAGVINWNQQLTGATSFAPFGGVKQSGNNRPSGLFAVDYCSYPVASIETENPLVPGTLPPGMDL